MKRNTIQNELLLKSGKIVQFLVRKEQGKWPPHCIGFLHQPKRPVTIMADKKNQYGLQKTNVEKGESSTILTDILKLLTEKIVVTFGSSLVQGEVDVPECLREEIENEEQQLSYSGYGQ